MLEPKADAAMPSIEIRFVDLSLQVQVTEAASARTMTTVFKTILDVATAVPRKVIGLATGKSTTTTHSVKLLDNVSGVIRPGTMTLLLGAPGAGKSSLLKALTGRLKNQADLKGDVTYSGLTVKGLSEAGLHLGQLVQYVSQARVAASSMLHATCRSRHGRCVVSAAYHFQCCALDGPRRAPGDRYCWHMCCISTCSAACVLPQLDEHFPHLTVDETLMFVARNALANTDEAGVRARVDEISALLHLKARAAAALTNACLRAARVIWNWVVLCGSK
jgi:energy-coupling factor transporter ATP-binding protein EcfA2